MDYTPLGCCWQREYSTGSWRSAKWRGVGEGGIDLYTLSLSAACRSSNTEQYGQALFQAIVEGDHEGIVRSVSMRRSERERVAPGKKSKNKAYSARVSSVVVFGLDWNHFVRTR